MRHKLTADKPQMLYKIIYSLEIMPEIVPAGCFRV